MKQVKEIRSTFQDYFKRQGHEVVQSAPLVPHNDPTLMFVNAGMVPFKDVFTGKETRSYNRATSSQKCVRAGGKHNDLENVGYTARHHTFFEMLGNFSFGDYFKEDAIRFAWELCTKDFGLPAEKLLVTIFHTDDEAADLWKKIAGLPDEKIIRIPTSDNFWAMGDTGPCGPCSEIFYDHGEHIPGGPPGSPDEDGDRFIEIWNLVFMQYEQVTKDKRIDLPKPSIDTGMGLERISTILQGVHNNFDIDLFRNIIEHSADLTSQSADQVSHKVIVDHLRAASFLIADGVLPSNEGRGYVLRRIMRRGMRHAHLLGAKDPLMYRLFPTLQTEMREAYPELDRAGSLISETLRIEEERFKKTLDRGLKLLSEETSKLSGKTLPGEVAFKLYDTYGFPLDLTQDALRAEGISVDTDGFNAAMKLQKEEARKSWSGSGEAATEKLWYELEEKLGATDFLGYVGTKAEGQVTAIIKDSALVDSAKEGEAVQVLANQTPFYGESGGQIGDIGVMSSENGLLTVSDTQKKLGKLHVHIGTVSKGTLKVGDAVVLEVDGKRRDAIKANHSATHLLHAALRMHLGDHVTQKGSLVAPDRMRFDFSHPKALSEEEIVKVENTVNEMVLSNTDVETAFMPIDDAIEHGAIALFGEKYDDEVRVLTMGDVMDETGKAFSIELCGGTHVSRTGDVGLFKITSETAVAGGIRRIEAVTALGALDYLRGKEDVQSQLAEKLKVSESETVSRVEALLAERKKMEREIADLRKKLATGGGAGQSTGSSVKDVGGIPFAARVLEDIPAKDLKPMADEMKKQLGSAVIALVAVNEGKASVVIAVTDDLTGKVSAVDLVRVASEALGGKGGGGRPDMAQAGGPDGANAQRAIDALEQKLPELASKAA